jgi:hypothetical protein
MSHKRRAPEVTVCRSGVAKKDILALSWQRSLRCIPTSDALFVEFLEHFRPSGGTLIRLGNQTLHNEVLHAPLISPHSTTGQAKENSVGSLAKKLVISLSSYGSGPGWPWEMSFSRNNICRKIFSRIFLTPSWSPIPGPCPYTLGKFNVVFRVE